MSIRDVAPCIPLGETDKQVMLAKKTLENVQLISTADVILKEKFNGDPNSWVRALFEAVSLKNPIYLMEEQKADDVVKGILNNKFEESFWNKDNHHEITATGCELINGFKKFMIGLKRNADSSYSENWAADLEEIKTSIQAYLNSIRSTAQTGMTFELNGESAFEKQIGGKEKEAARKPDVSQLCPECNTNIAIFNNDFEFSYQLHCQETLHKKAIAKPTSKTVEQTTKVFEKRRPEAEIFTKGDEYVLRKMLQKQLKQHSKFIRILSKRDFYCDLCNCAISSVQNVESHVEGSKHTNTWRASLGASNSSDDFILVDPSYIPVAKLM